MMKRNCLLLALTALAASGCVSNAPQLVGSQAVTVIDANELPPPTLARADGAFVLGPLDKIRVRVAGIEELNQDFQIDASGAITFPYAGRIQAGGKTPAELAEAITDGLRRGHVRNPQVSVNLEETVSRTITVDGEVGQPGQYPVAARMTLMRAVAQARGLTEFARARHVVVFRTVGGRDMAALYDLAAIRQGLYSDPQVYPDDVIVVGSSQARRLFRDILAGSGLLIAPIVALLQRP
jgi:polysaccharide export outer membrane protein